jgi:hypothetical protein
LSCFDSTLDVGKRLQRDIQRVSRKIKPAKPDLHLSYFFFTKSLTSLEAMKLLWEKGFFQDSLILSRSIFETFVLDAYIRIDPTERVPRYLAYEAAARHALAVGMIRSLKNRSSHWQKQWGNYASKHGRTAKNSPYSFDETQGWSGKSLREIVRLVERKYGNEGIWMDYEFFYALGSAVAHSSVLSMQEYMRRPHRTSYQQHGQIRAYLQNLPILVCRWCLLTGFLSAQDHFQLHKDLVPGDALVDAYYLLISLSHDLGEDPKGLL